jgi:hypothetical protein
VSSLFSVALMTFCYLTEAGHLATMELAQLQSVKQEASVSYRKFRAGEKKLVLKLFVCVSVQILNISAGEKICRRKLFKSGDKISFLQIRTQIQLGSGGMGEAESDQV